MALADRILQLKLVTDVSDISKGTRSAEGRLGGFARKAKSMLALGLVTEGIERVTEALGNAWEGYREGEKANARLGNSWKRLELPADELETSISDIGDAAKAIGFDDVEMTDAFNRLVLATGDPEEAMKRLGIAADLVASGTATDMESAIKIIQQASNGSKRAVDQFGLSADTAAGRVAELGSKVAGAAEAAAAMDPVGVTMNALSEDLESIVGSLAQGDIEGAFAGIAAAGDDIDSFLAKIGPQIQTFLDALTGGAFGDFITGAQTLAEDIGPDVIAMLQSWLGATQAMIGAIQNVITFLQPLIDALAPAVAGSLGFMLELTRGLLDTVAKLLTGDFSGAFDAAGETIGNLATIITDTIGAVLQGLIDILPNFADAAADIGRAIIDGIVNAVRGVADRITSLIRGAINGMIDLWNGVGVIPAGAINLMTWGEQGIAGTPLHIDAGSIGLSWGSMDIIPNIPKLASGGIVTRPTLALIGEGGREAVLPLGAGGLGDTFVTINIAAGVGDPVEIGRQVDRVLTAYRKRAGKPI